MQKSQTGFTLIELLVVLVIIGILAGYIGPKIMGHPEEAKRTKANLQIQAISTALKMYKLDNGMYPSTEQGLQALIRAANEKIAGVIAQMADVRMMDAELLIAQVGRERAQPGKYWHLGRIPFKIARMFKRQPENGQPLVLIFLVQFGEIVSRVMTIGAPASKHVNHSRFAAKFGSIQASRFAIEVGKT